MPRSDDILRLPPDMPVPVDDGMAKHLFGMPVATVSLRSTWGEEVDLSTLQGRTVVYCYPRTGRPDEEPPDGWNLIPGARGCTPQSCAFRDHHRELQAFGARLFGLSTQDTEYQREAAERLHLPFPLLSDVRLEFASAMRLPLFQVGSMQLLKRLTLIISDRRVEHVFYPVFPPDRNAEQVLDWLHAHRHDRNSGSRSWTSVDHEPVMEFSIVEEGGTRVVEGVPDRHFMSRVEDANRVIEACVSSRTRSALLYAENLTDGFFDLSSGEAGAVLQKLRNYGVRLAVVCPAGSVQFSRRFGEMIAEERLRQYFGVFETRQTAREWLGQFAGS